MNTKIEKLLERLHIDYQNIKYYREAFMHSTFINEHHLAENDYQRLEFFGDSVLSFVISKYLYEKYPYYEEGRLTQIRLNLVEESSLANLARKVKLGDGLLLGNGAEKSNFRDQDSILCDIFESFIAALYFDLGLKQVEEFVLPLIKNIEFGEKDAKSLLQEFLQAGDQRAVKYEITAKEGPANDPYFTVVALIDGVVYGSGSGKTKKDAEKAAAKDALSKLVA